MGTIGRLAYIGLAVTALVAHPAAGQDDDAPVGKSVPVRAEDGVDAIARDVYDLFQMNCVFCHGEDTELAGGLDLRTEDGLRRGGDGGPVVIAHSPAASTIYTSLIRTSEPYMPYDEDPLPDEEIALVRRWIESGGSLAGVPAATSKDGPSAEDLARLENRPITDEERAYWAFVSPARHPVPEVSDPAWAENPIDAYLFAAMEARDVTPAEPADRRALVRRAYLDVLGLPPTPDEVDAFVNDDSPDAWPALVDRLLESPHYGERWARHWMDLARYADSRGFEGDNDRPNMYRYRDYLIKSFNDDKPYDIFIKEQLAGDEFWPDSEEAKIATGFLRVGPEGNDVEQTRLDELDDLVNATSLTFMAATVSCARCHDHKFDPIAQKDYYRMQAVFYPTTRAMHPLVPAEEVAANEAERERVGALVDSLRKAKRSFEEPYLQILIKREVAKLPDYLQEAWNTPEEERTDGQKLNAKQIAKSLRAGSREARISEDEIISMMSPTVAMIHAVTKTEIEDVSRQRPRRLPSVRVIGEKGRQPEPSHFLHRGSATAKGSVMTPGVLAVASQGEWNFPDPPEDASTSWRRRGFAEWLADRDNPLTARVLVNRIWQHHFGEGIVRTPSNFGKMGEPPSHPQLLDWLALEFIDSGWSIKAMHRLMLNTRAYQMASDDVETSVAIDPENRLLWRMPRVRLEAEIIRDSILTTAGTLDRTLGGPAILPHIPPYLFATSSGRRWRGLPDDDPTTWRRSIYVFSKRSIRYPFFETFDQSNPVASIDRRNRTTVAPQSLTLMNNPMVTFQASKFADRVRSEAGDDVEAQVQRAILLALGRESAPDEQASAVNFVGESADGLDEFCHLLFNLNEFLYRP